MDPDWIQIRIGIQPEMLDPDPYQMNTDPKHRFHMAGSHEEFATTSCFSELAFLGSIGMPFSRFFLKL
jgi:hypothetical protein